MFSLRFYSCSHILVVCSFCLSPNFVTRSTEIVKLVWRYYRDGKSQRQKEPEKEKEVERKREVSRELQEDR